MNMSYQDIIEGEQVSVINLGEEENIKTLYNPLYMPIIKILREGYKTFKEIKIEYTKYGSTVPPDKTLYRHLNTLKDAGLVIEIGKRVYKGKAMTEKLFARTAKFFYTSGTAKEEKYKQKMKREAVLLSKLFTLTRKADEDSAKCIETFLNTQNDRHLKIIDDLFTKHPDEVAEIAGSLPHDDLQALVEDYVQINILLNFPEIIDELKKCLGVK